MGEWGTWQNLFGNRVEKLTFGTELRIISTGQRILRDFSVGSRRFSSGFSGVLRFPRT